MRMIFLLGFLISSHVMAHMEVPEDMELIYMRIFYDSLSPVDSAVPNKKNGKIYKFALNGSGRVHFYKSDLRSKKLRHLRGMDKDFNSKSITVNFKFLGDHFLDSSLLENSAQCYQFAQERFERDEGMILVANVLWPVNELDQIYKSTDNLLPVNVINYPDHPFHCMDRGEMQE